MTNVGISFFFYYFITIFLSLMTCIESSKVVLVGHKHNNATLCFDGIEANFTPHVVKESGEGGVLYMAQPHDACSTLTTNKVEGASLPQFVLIVRGGVCSFEDKVRRAQAAGYEAAIIYDDKDGGILVAMEGNSAGVRIHAVFVSKVSGEKLKKYAAGHTDMELWIIPTLEENSVWSIFAVIFISLLGMCSLLATCFFVKRFQYIRAEQRVPASRFQKFHGMSSVLVKAMPSQIFTSVVEDPEDNNCTTSEETCAICLENYVVGEELRILPCLHKFHAFCVDSWLTTTRRRALCPLCRHDARPTPSSHHLPSSETTPLLSSSTPASSSSEVSSSP